MTRELRVLVGVPGVGKSHWARKEAWTLEEEGWSAAVISRDAIRFAKLDENPTDDYFAYESWVFKDFIAELNDCLALGIDYVFADATHISPASRMKLLRSLRLDPHTRIVFEVFDFPLEIALYRNGLRKGRECVPVSAIKSMKSSFRVPDISEIRDIYDTLNIDNEIVVNKHEKEET